MSPSTEVGENPQRAPGAATSGRGSAAWSSGAAARATPSSPASGTNVTSNEKTPTIQRRADGRFVARVVADDGRVVEIELAPDVTTIEQAKRALADLRRVTPRAPKSR